MILNAPAVFRFTAPADPGRHLEAARLMGADVRGARPEDAGELLAGAIITLMRQTGMPNGLKAVGYAPEDVDALVAGTIVQHRVTKLSPRPASEADLKAAVPRFHDALVRCAPGGERENHQDEYVVGGAACRPGRQSSWSRCSSAATGK